MDSHRHLKMSQKSFTLVEIMIVVGILALLSAIAIPYALKTRLTANDVMAQSTLKAISNAFENYLAINGNYPTSIDDVTNLNPPYINENYFIGQHSGFTFASSLDTFSYAVTASPVELGRTGTTTYIIMTGGVFQSN